MTTAWMWHDEASNSVMSAQVDLEKQTIHWYDEPGCACTDSRAEQPISDFLTNGPRYLMPPEDILAEMRHELTSNTA